MARKFVTPTDQAISNEISRFIHIGKDAYLDDVGRGHRGKTYFIRVEDHYVDMKAIWFGASVDKSKSKANSAEIKPILDSMGYDIFHGTPTDSKKINSLESHKRAESSYWSRNQKLAATRRGMAKFRCEACNLHYPEMYKGLGATILEVHHLTPFAKTDRRASVEVHIKDVVALCANCHRMIHELGRSTGNNPSLSDVKKTIMQFR
jgi:HNH endonuclease